MTKLIVLFCMSVLAGYGVVVLLFDAYEKLGRLRQWLRTHDERALLNRQRQAARDREDRKTERRADRMAQIHGVMTGDVIHSTTPYCDYLDTPRNAVPYIRPRKRTMQAGEL